MALRSSEGDALVVDHPRALSRPVPGQLSSIEEAIAAMARGEIVIVVDDPSRENEGDFVMAADKVTPEAVNFMTMHGRGLVCLPMAPPLLDRLGLRAMVPEHESSAETAFTVSIDIKEPRNTGISALDRARTVERAVAPDARADEFRAPGHIFPLRARAAGVLERAGHTEAAVDLARLAGLTPAGVICEIMNPDGSMARLDDLFRVAATHGLHVVTIADLIEYRRTREAMVERVASANLPTAYGMFTAVGYRSLADGLEHIALVYGDPGDAPLVRLHSECLTGDVLGSLRCDCGAQLKAGMRAIAREGAGIIVYIRGHEGRGIGMLHKLAAYRLQDDGQDTVEANLALGFPADGRDYRIGAAILTDLGARAVRLLTNNPAKRAGLERYGIGVSERVPLETEPTIENLRYLQAKRDKLAHDLTLIDLGLTLSAE